MARMPEVLTLTLRVSVDLTFWEAIKWRIAGPEFREAAARRLRASVDEDGEGEEWKRRENP